MTRVRHQQPARSPVRPGDWFAWPALAIFVVALTVRVMHLWQIRGAPFFTVLMGDSRAYDDWAQRIAQGDWLGHEVFYQAPLYPYFLGAIYATAGHDLLIVRVCQAILATFRRRRGGRKDGSSANPT